MNSTSVETYNEEYYSKYGLNHKPYINNKWLQRVLEGITHDLISLLHPDTILDVGCALGYTVKYALDLGVNAYGIDFSEYAVKNSFAPERIYQFDITRPIEFPISGSFDLTMCIEVLEHIEEKYVDYVIHRMCYMTNKYIYFSSTCTDFEDPTHINVQPPEYWIKKFEERGFIKYEYYDDKWIDWSHLFISKDLLP